VNVIPSPIDKDQQQQPSNNNNMPTRPTTTTTKQPVSPRVSAAAPVAVAPAAETSSVQLTRASVSV
jgi:hypothetical protein